MAIRNGKFLPIPISKELANKKTILSCIEVSMLNNYFLHFAGSWERRNVQI